MRSLANRLQVKAASLYWHVRDRRELLELLAESILESTPRGRRGAGWRQAVVASADALRRRVSAQQDATRVLLEVPDALEASPVFAEIRAQLVEIQSPGADLEHGPRCWRLGRARDPRRQRGRQPRMLPAAADGSGADPHLQRRRQRGAAPATRRGCGRGRTYRRGEAEAG